MNFRTLIEKPAYNQPIEYTDKLLFVGSCFSENIGNRVKSLKFTTTINPFGVSYNPLSIVSILDTIASGNHIESSLLCQREDKWYSYMHTTKLYGESIQMLTKSCQEITNRAHKALLESNKLFVTLGTSWIYRLKESGAVVNNCLKMPDNIFIRESLTVQQIVESFEELLAKHPMLLSKSIYLTVSPIRHKRDGYIENSRSKATLIVACHTLAQKFPNIFYFPAYEIMNDELRDYRFYQADMIHPSEVAVEYIFERLQSWAMTPKAVEFCKDNTSIVSAMNHRCEETATESQKRFWESCVAKIKKISPKYPEISYLYEVKHFEDKL